MCKRRARQPRLEPMEVRVVLSHLGSDLVSAHAAEIQNLRAARRAARAESLHASQQKLHAAPPVHNQAAHHAPKKTDFFDSLKKIFGF